MIYNPPIAAIISSLDTNNKPIHTAEVLAFCVFIFGLFVVFPLYVYIKIKYIKYKNRVGKK